jgi:hypothetical protein
MYLTSYSRICGFQAAQGLQYCTALPQLRSCTLNSLAPTHAVTTLFVLVKSACLANQTSLVLTSRIPHFRWFGAAKVPGPLVGERSREVHLALQFNILQGCFPRHVVNRLYFKSAFARIALLGSCRATSALSKCLRLQFRGLFCSSTSRLAVMGHRA